ncbi:MAG: T9SS type A sorting domain-containing protein [Bacteroidetes bacterium]|nr:MAG: T9SS type A sorting domain-containing protein [Bacteroidota bacterium]
MKSLISFILLSLSISTLAQTTLTVTNLNDSGPGSLRQQIFNSNAGDTVQFDPALLANGSDTLKLFYSINIPHGLTINGGINGSDTIYIDGQDSIQIFYINFSSNPGVESVTISELAIINGKSYSADWSIQTSNGGGIMAHSLRHLNLNNISIKNCRTSGEAHGGAIIAYSCDSFSLTNAKVIGNHTDSISSNTYGGVGGAVKMYSGKLIIKNTIFSHNYCAGMGGAIFLVSGSIYCESSVFKKNSTGVLADPMSRDLNGGAICFTSTGISHFVSTSFFDNNANLDGGAIGIFTNGSQSALYIDNCTFDGNKSLNEGGALFQSYTPPIFIRNSTFYNNSASQYNCISAAKSELHIENSTFFSTSSNQNGPLIYTNTSVSNDISSTILIAPQNKLTINNISSWTSMGNNIFSDSSSFTVSSDQTNLDSTTLALEPLAMNGGLTPTMLPGPTSVALNAGNPTDFSDAQNGPIYGRRDIGAAERPVISYDTTSACTPVNWWGNTYSTAGTYTDTAFNANSIDSVGVLILMRQDTSVYDLNGTLYASEQDTNTTYQWVDCTNNYAIITGATSRGFLPPANGSYAVILTNQNCVDTSSCISYNRFSISERSSTQDWLTFYPNPSSGTIHYSFTGNAPTQVEVLDLSGRNITTFELDGESTLHLTNLVSGTYLLRWISNDGNIQVDRICVGF